MPRFIPPLGVNTFLGLTDTPSSYAGQAGKLVEVKSTEDGLEFIALPAEGFKKVAEYTATTDVTQITFTGLDINTDKFYYIIFNTSNPTASDSYFSLYVENDLTATNYYCQYIYSYGATIVADSRNNAYIGWIADGQCGVFSILLIRAPTGYPRAISSGTYRGGTGPSQTHLCWTKLATVTNVTRIDIVASTANSIGAGSKIIIYGAAA